MVMNTNVQCAQNRIIIHLMFPFRFNFIHYYLVSQKKHNALRNVSDCWNGNICTSHSLLTFFDLFSKMRIVRFPSLIRLCSENLNLCINDHDAQFNSIWYFCSGFVSVVLSALVCNRWYDEYAYEAVSFHATISKMYLSHTLAHVLNSQHAVWTTGRSICSAVTA